MHPTANLDWVGSGRGDPHAVFLGLSGAWGDLGRVLVLLSLLLNLLVASGLQPFFPEFRGTTRNVQDLRGGLDCDSVYLTLTGAKRVWGWRRADETAGRPD